jgi:hypothetical protein
MARRIYRIIIAVSIVLGIYLLMTRVTHSNTFLISIACFVFILFSIGVHGLIAHSLNPKLIENTVFYPLLMGLLWGVLLLLFVFFMIPSLCPDFFFLDLK